MKTLFQVVISVGFLWGIGATVFAVSEDVDPEVFLWVGWGVSLLWVGVCFVLFVTPETDFPDVSETFFLHLLLSTVSFCLFSYLAFR